MEFGVWLLNIGDHQYSNPDAFERVALAAEVNGFDVVCTGDHLVIPDEIPDTYPSSSSGEAPLEVDQDVYEAFDLLSFVTGITDDIGLMVNICVVPYRHPVVLARNVLTVAALSDGRLEFGAGAGWMEPEFDILDVPFEERGARTDEFLSLYERILEERELFFDGEFHSFQQAGFHPVPDEEDAPTVWIGGKSGAAMRRVAEFGDGWTTTWTRAEEVGETRDRIANAWADYDRDGRPEIAVLRPAHLGTDTSLDQDRPLIGAADSVIDDVEEYASAGTTRMMITAYDTDVDAQIEQIERFGDEILPSF